jgi:Fe-S cluster assembly iron-binding protein IscA
VSVSAGAAPGFQYGFDWRTAPAAEDQVFGPPTGAARARVFVDPVSLDLLAGSELDGTRR